MRVVFLHGVGSPPSVDELQAPLLRVLGEQNVHLDGPLSIVAPSYEDLLRNPPESAGPQPEFTYTAPSRDQRVADAEGFRARQKAMEDRLRRHRDQEPLRSRAPALIKNRMPEVISRGPAGDLRLAFNYRKDEARRHAIWSRVLDSIELRTPLVLVGHSLGSAIAIDLLKRLQGNHVQLLLTLGSPLGAIRLAGDHGVDTVFPYDVLDYWVNMYDALDPVTQGRGLRRHFWASGGPSRAPADDGGPGGAPARSGSLPWPRGHCRRNRVRSARGSAELATDAARGPDRRMGRTRPADVLCVGARSGPAPRG